MSRDGQAVRQGSVGVDIQKRRVYLQVYGSADATDDLDADVGIGIG